MHSNFTLHGKYTLAQAHYTPCTVLVVYSSLFTFARFIMDIAWPRQNRNLKDFFGQMGIQQILCRYENLQKIVNETFELVNSYSPQMKCPDVKIYMFLVENIWTGKDLYFKGFRDKKQKNLFNFSSVAFFSYYIFLLLFENLHKCWQVIRLDFISPLNFSS